MKNRKQKHNQIAASLSLSLTYYCYMLRFLKDLTTIMMFHLVFNKPIAPTSEVLKKLRTYSVSDHNNEVEAGGNCDPEKGVEDLKKLFQVEITLKIDKNNTNNN
ncbi:hypothetical protein CsSME_00028581 [Camellia sinensis var. sinensis]